MNTIGLVVWMFEEAEAANVRELIIVNVGDVGNCVNETVNWISNVSVAEKLSKETERNSLLIKI